ncbi:ABC transporter permease subunit (plasmid) [Deinococcus metallilatus]|uniref:ABC transporter permease subunit n=1 Tax=Deinococcus metallilatus TaxID=1211322 RepID=A0AAJ5F6F4_9DEIO|nr:ABC transporter permease subunit [Deinococcus metallilatus]MBB5295686.1 putative spermidine/putrescine transport system permease protein [Deinococcus metallilatus]QBY06861.1 ABC transporter permease subunit [Deinococcus metallilatus]TLK32250.1 ABC transporter permease subunit [Deinococcus metallilatus]GMA14216.1 ABC transporter permease [Deinococcus metallilatus]
MKPTSWFWHYPPLRKALTIIMLAVFGAFLLLPLVSLLLWAVAERWNYPGLIPQQFGLRWWSWIFTNADIGKAARWSALTAPTVTLVSAAVCLPAAYAFARFDFPLKRVLYVSLLASNAFPKIGLYIVIAAFFFQLNLIGTFWGVVLVQLINTLVYMTWIPAASFAAVPRELEEAARDLGASPLKVFFTVTLPFAMPGIIVAVILTFLGSLDESQATLVVGAPEITTLPILMYTLVSSYPEPVGAVFSVLLALPSVVLLLLARKYLLGGYLAAGFKGG